MIGGAFGGDSGQQSAYIQQLQNEANGTGPNPAQQMLTQQTQNNNAMAAGQIASAQGLSPALRERQIMETQAGNNQRAAGQGAVMQAQQQAAALQQEGASLAAQRAADAQFTGSLASGFGTAIPMGGPAQAPIGQAAGAAGSAGGGGAVDAGAVDAGSAVGGSDAAAAAALMFSGGPVPGKPLVPMTNTPKNDTIKAKLTPGEIVLPLTVTQSPDASKKAADFVAAIQEKKARENGPQGYSRLLAKHRELEDRMGKLEKRG